MERQQKQILLLEQKLQKLEQQQSNIGNNSQSGVQIFLHYSQSLAISSFRRASSCLTPVVHRLMSNFVAKHKEKTDDPFDVPESGGGSNNNNNNDVSL